MSKSKINTGEAEAKKRFEQALKGVAKPVKKPKPKTSKKKKKREQCHRNWAGEAAQKNRSDQALDALLLRWPNMTIAGQSKERQQY